MPQLDIILIIRILNPNQYFQHLSNKPWERLPFSPRALSVVALSEYLNIQELLPEVVLQPECQDEYRWKISSAGQYTAKSAYEAFFIESTSFDAWRFIWNTWAPKKY